MSDEFAVDHDFKAAPGAVDEVTPSVRRLVAPNPGPFTFTGTCTYIIGRGRVAIIDPGPADGRHVAAILAAVAGETVSHVVVTHTHRDHSPAARMIAAETGAPIAGCLPHRLSRPVALGEFNPLDASGDADHAPDLPMQEGDAISGSGWTLTAVATPGHTANHLAFAFPQENALFSGDHVMGWSTTIVAPPDGAMADYMASLDKLRGRGEAVYWPGHGGPIREPQRYVRGLLTHRRQRETAILARIADGDETIEAIVPRLYEGLAPALRGAAALSVFAHLEDLVARGLVKTDGPPALDGRYRPGHGG
jgi:glyoxylase-like metal-dependent hydrolase (beta-lactamase superfamily II)